MILSHRHRFIFLKTTKTAGTSIEIALSRFCGPDDVITPISDEDETLRSELGHRGPQNFLHAPHDGELTTGVRVPLKQWKRDGFYNHISAGEVRAHVGDRVWSDYVTFAVERNPWDRVVSLYHWLHRDEPRPTMAEFLESGAPQRLKRKGFGVYGIDGAVAVDRVCRFEDLAEELETLRLEIGLPDALHLPHAKGRFRGQRDRYREHFDPASRQRVAELFADEIRLFGYAF